MHLIIDGYNFLKRDGAHEIDAHARSHFVAHLGRYAKKKGHKIVVVFDGGPYQWPDTEEAKGVKVIFSGERVSADEYIKNYLVEHVQAQLLLVSSDRELVEYANIHGIYSLEIHAFAHFLYPDIQQSSQENIKKLSGSIDTELDELMEQSVPPVKDVPLSQPVNMHKISKRERAMMRILKKL